MKNWDYIKLGELCTIKAGGTPSRSNKSYYNGQIPWVKIRDMKGNSILETEETITELGLENSNAKLIPGGTLLISIFATIGRTSILGIDAATNQAIAALLINKKDLIKNTFLKYYLDYSVRKLINKGRGVAQNNINLSILKDLDIPIAPISMQLEISELLNEVEICIKKRKESTALLDDFLKSTFIEMFGDMITNSKDWKLTEFENVIHLKRGYDLPVKKRISGKYNVVSSSKIIGTHNEYKVNGPGIVTGRSGTIGLVQLIKGDFWPLNTTLYADSLNGNDPYFLKYFLEGYKLKRFSQGAGVPTLNRNLFLKNLVPQIPFDLQEKFADIVKQTELLKSKYQESEKELKNLFGSLMQRAFNGEL
tara:strand:+ start:1471 stop:2565 length:1095 start_codon:yes stop_codon:yes gene_type:complete